jgi:spore germination protein (amino acid permease)
LGKLPTYGILETLILKIIVTKRNKGDITIMNKHNINLLTPYEFCSVLVGALIGIAILSTPNAIVQYAKQDAWVSELLGCVYPFYLLLLGIFISNRFPKENILVLSKKYLGNFFGSILNLGFLLFFLLYIVASVSGASNLLRVYVVPFLSPSKVLAAILIMSCYTAYMGIKAIGKVSQASLYILFLLFILPIFALPIGNILNVKPILGSGFKNILAGTKESLFSYAGFEQFFLIYPLINDRKKIKAAGFFSILITTIIFTWFVFITIYYLGIDIIPKTMWSFLFVPESVHISSISNFRLVYIFMWFFIEFRLVAIYSHNVVFIAQSFSKKINKLIIFIFLFFIAIFLCLNLTDEIVRRNFLTTAIPISVLFSIFYITLIAIIILIKRDRAILEK